MEERTDEYFIQKALAGDIQSFTILIDRYKDLVYTLSLRLVKNREEAEELSQDVFLKVHRSLSQFRGASKFSTWLYRIVYTTGINRIKKNAREPLMIDLDSVGESQFRMVHDALHELTRKENQEIVRNCLLKLPEKDQYILTLYYFEELSLKEMVEILSINLNNVKVRLFRSRKKLFALLHKALVWDKSIVL
ncbi:MAG: RNA polymerase sigma factor [Cyclobacteriaceae bacterium]